MLMALITQILSVIPKAPPPGGLKDHSHPVNCHPQIHPLDTDPDGYEVTDEYSC